MNKLNEWIKKEETGINRELFQKHFKMQRPSDMSKDNLINEIEDMGNEDKEIKNPNKIVDIVEKILEFNDRNQRDKD